MTSDRDGAHGFATGEVVLYREVDRGRVLDVKPVTVIEDAERMLLWLPGGTATKRPVLHDHVPGTPRVWTDDNWDLRDAAWGWANAVIFVRPQQRRATWVLWHLDGRFQGWWVNLQSELRRTPLGFDFRDHQLDVLVEPDRTWRLKDEDELDAAFNQGQFTRADVIEIGAEADLAVADVEANRPPFSDDWAMWSPPSNLPRPHLREGWDNLSMYNDGVEPHRR